MAGVRNTDIQQSGASRHFSVKHDGDISTMQAYAIEKVFKPIRGGDWWWKLLNREAFWILRLGSRSPQGMNLRNDLMYIYGLPSGHSLGGLMLPRFNIINILIYPSHAILNSVSYWIYNRPNYSSVTIFFNILSSHLYYITYGRFALTSVVLESRLAVFNLVSQLPIRLITIFF